MAAHPNEEWGPYGWRDVSPAKRAKIAAAGGAGASSSSDGGEGGGDGGRFEEEMEALDRRWEELMLTVDDNYDEHSGLEQLEGGGEEGAGLQQESGTAEQAEEGGELDEDEEAEEDFI